MSTMSDLKTWRTQREMTQAALAALLGTTPPTVCRIEAGEQWPAPQLMLAIERVTQGKVTASHILAHHMSAAAAAQ